jgi:hypothetical protein
VVTKKEQRAMVFGEDRPGFKFQFCLFLELQTLDSHLPSLLEVQISPGKLELGSL